MRTTALLLLAAPLMAQPSDDFFRALHIVETGGKRGSIRGDSGASLGPLQISRKYHADSRVSGSYARCADLDYSKRVVSGYLQRWAPEAWKAGDVVTLARVHNGGPRGTVKPQTLTFANRVTAHMPSRR